VNCPSCGGSMRLEPAKECLVCNYCENIVFPEPNQDGVRVLGEPSATACPVCGVPLRDAALTGHRILYCERCRGMLVSIDDFLAIVEQRRAELGGVTEPPHAPDWNEMKRRVDCPECGETMDTHPYGGPGNIIIDNCEHCRLNWLDHNELLRIARAADTARSAGWIDPLALPAPPELSPRIGLPPRRTFFEQQPAQGTQVVENTAAGGHVLSKILQFVRHQLQRLFMA
jgi:Zn-finger nucleic acid-binding protein